MITVRFYGGLAKYGRRFNMQADTPAQALRLLLVQLDGLRQTLSDGLYQVRFKKEDFSEDTLVQGFHEKGEGVLHIVPRVAGAGKNGGIQVLIGVALIAVSWFVGGAAGWGYLGASGLQATVATAIFMVGVSTILTGVTQMLTKPKKPDTGKGAEGSRNSAFNSLGNPTGQGNPVPVLYGIRRCGAHTVSQAIESRRLAGNGQPEAQNTSSEGFLTVINKEYTAGVAARDPKGRPYNTDFTNDSVRQRNYRAVVKRV